jgi:Lipocalin-like domain
LQSAPAHRHARNPDARTHGWQQVETVWHQSEGYQRFGANGRFFLMVASADNSRIAARDPNETNQEDVGGLIAESIAYYGTYTVNEEVNVISLHLDASTFPNQIGTDQKRAITSLTADELKYSSPAATSGFQVHQVWKRAE